MARIATHPSSPIEGLLPWNLTTFQAYASKTARQVFPGSVFLISGNFTDL